MKLLIKLKFFNNFRTIDIKTPIAGQFLFQFLGKIVNIK